MWKPSKYYVAAEHILLQLKKARGYLIWSYRCLKIQIYGGAKFIFIIIAVVNIDPNKSDFDRHQRKKKSNKGVCLCMFLQNHFSLVYNNKNKKKINKLGTTYT